MSTLNCKNTITNLSDHVPFYIGQAVLVQVMKYSKTSKVRTPISERLPEMFLLPTQDYV